MKHSDCTISIICHSAFEECKRTLSAVLDSREGAHLILTANGNPEAAEYFEKLATQREGVTVIVNAENKGFVVPSNWAFSLCETEYLVLLNDDALPPTCWLDKLKEAMKEDVAIAGPGDRWLDHNFVGHKWRGGEPIEPDFIEGSCMMIRVAAFKDHGELLFWPDLKMAYCEDADACLRIRQLGYKIAVADFAILHKAGTTSRTVAGLVDIVRPNFELCRKRWEGYLKTRRFT